MVKGIQHRSSGADEASLIAACRAARRAGFEAIQPTLAETGAISLAMAETQVRRMGATIRDEGLATPALACLLPAGTPLSSNDDAVRQQACAALTAAMDRAAWLGAGLLVVEAGDIGDPADRLRQRTSYADAVNALHAALDVLVVDAETRGVVIALTAPADRFLLSPVEMRDLVDAIASPWVQVCVDVAAAQGCGFPADWIETLGARIGSIHVHDRRGHQLCMPGDGEVDWPAVAAALKRVRYAGLLVCPGPGEAADLAQRLNHILARS